MRKNKKFLHIMVPSLLVVILLIMVIGFSTAYLTHSPEEVVNRITLGWNELDAILIEPDWDGIIDYIYEENGDITPVSESPSREPYGKKLAERIIPGMTIPKNPLITNTSLVYDEWAAIKVWFVYGKGHKREGQPMDPVDYMRVMDVINIDYNTDDWNLVAGGEIGEGDKVVDDAALSPYKEFYYKTKLAKATAAGTKGEATEPIFTQVSVKPKASNAQIEILQDMHGFVIYVEGFVAQAQYEETYDSFEEWGLAGGVVYTNSPAAGSPVYIEDSGITGKPVNQ